jgi:ABC-type phosphate/phosphonate transport system ATPase subunit
MPKRSSKNKLDINLLAKSIVDDSTAEKLLGRAVESGKNPAAVLLGRLGGLKGGKARAAKLSAQKRKEIAQKAAQKRWETK